MSDTDLNDLSDVFNYEIPGGLEMDDCIEVIGVAEGKEVDLTLLSAKDDGSLPLSLKLFTGGTWVAEAEDGSDNKFHKEDFTKNGLQKDFAFRVKVEAKEKLYKILLNDKHLTDVPYLVPLSSVSHLNIAGEARFTAVEFKDSSSNGEEVEDNIESSFVRGNLRVSEKRLSTRIPNVVASTNLATAKSLGDDLNMVNDKSATMPSSKKRFNIGGNLSKSKDGSNYDIYNEIDGDPNINLNKKSSKSIFGMFKKKPKIGSNMTINSIEEVNQYSANPDVSYDAQLNLGNKKKSKSTFSLNADGSTPNLNGSLPSLKTNKSGSKLNFGLSNDYPWGQKNVNLKAPASKLKGSVPEVASELYDMNKSIDLMKIPDIEPIRIDGNFNPPTMDAKSSKFKFGLPKTKKPDVEGVDIYGKAPNVPEMTMKSDVSMPGYSAQLNGPDFDVSNFKGSKADLPVTNIALKNPKIDGSMPNLNIDGPNINLKKGDISLSKPDLSMGKADVKLPTFGKKKKKPSYDWRGSLSDLSWGVPNANFTMPAAKLKGDPAEIASKMYLTAPSLNLDRNFPEISPLRIDENMTMPEIKDIKGPSFKKPSFGLNRPSLDANMKTGDISSPDVTLPSVKFPTLKKKSKSNFDFDASVPNFSWARPNPNFKLPSAKLKGDPVELADRMYSMGPSMYTDYDLPDITPIKIDSNLTMPNVDLKKSGLGFKKPDLSFNKPNLTMPDMSLKGPDLSLNKPDLNLDLKKPNLNMPDVSLKTPDLSINKPNIDLSLKTPNLTMPNISVNKPDLDLNMSKPNIDLNLTKPNIDLNMKKPDLSMPDISMKTPDISLDKPDINLNLKKPNLNMPDVSLNAPDFSINKPNIDLNMKKPNLSMPDMSLKTPDLSIGKPDISLKKPDLSMPSAKFPTFGKKKKPSYDWKGSLSDLSWGMPNMNYTLPSAKLKGDVPEIANNMYLTSPSVRTDFDLPEIEPMKIDGNLALPTVKGTLPSVSGPNFKLPSFGVKKPSMDLNMKTPNISGPDLNVSTPDLSLSKPDLSLSRPDLSMKKPSVKFPTLGKKKKPSFDWKGSLSDLSWGVPNMNYTLPSAKLKGEVPEIANNMFLTSPSVKTDFDLPEIQPLKIDGNLALPSAKGTLPSVSGPNFKFPTFGIKKPSMDLNMKMPNISGPDLNVSTPDLSINKPDINMPSFNKPNIDLNLKKPDLSMPDISLKTPDLTLNKPNIDLNLKKPDLSMPDLSLKTPDLTLNKPNIDLNLKKPDLSMPDISLKKPDLSMPSAKFPTFGKKKKPSYDWKGSLSDLSWGVPNLSYTLPSSKLKGDVPEIANNMYLTSPSVRTDFDLPEIEPLKIDGNLALPTVKGTLPSVNGPSFKFPTFGMKKPSIDMNMKAPNISGPDLNVSMPDLSLSKPDLSLSGPDLSLSKPDLSMKKPDINMPTVKFPTIGKKKKPSYDFRGSLSDLSWGVPNLSYTLPSSKLKGDVPEIANNMYLTSPSVGAGFNLPEIQPLKIDGNLALPTVKGTLPSVNGPSFKFPTFGMKKPSIDMNMKVPELSGPDLSLSGPDLNLKKPDLSLSKPDLSVSKPDISMPSFKWPTFGKRGKPSLDWRGSLPDLNWTRPNLQLKLPAANLKGEAPEIADNMFSMHPSINPGVDWPDIEPIKIDGNMALPKGTLPSVNGPNFKFPSFGMKKPSIDMNMKVPELSGPDLSLSGPDLNLKKPDLNKPDINLPSFKWPTFGKKSKAGLDTSVDPIDASLKMPDFSLPSFKWPFGKTSQSSSWNVVNPSYKLPEAKLKAEVPELADSMYSMGQSARLSYDIPDVDPKMFKVNAGNVAVNANKAPYSSLNLPIFDAGSSPKYNFSSGYDFRRFKPLKNATLKKMEETPAETADEMYKLAPCQKMNWDYPEISPVSIGPVKSVKSPQPDKINYIDTYKPTVIVPGVSDTAYAADKKIAYPAPDTSDYKADSKYFPSMPIADTFPKAFDKNKVSYEENRYDSYKPKRTIQSSNEFFKPLVAGSHVKSLYGGIKRSQSVSDAYITKGADGKITINNVAANEAGGKVSGGSSCGDISEVIAGDRLNFVTGYEPKKAAQKEGYDTIKRTTLRNWQLKSLELSQFIGTADYDDSHADVLSIGTISSVDSEDVNFFLEDNQVVSRAFTSNRNKVLNNEEMDFVTPLPMTMTVGRKATLSGAFKDGAKNSDYAEIQLQSNQGLKLLKSNADFDDCNLSSDNNLIIRVYKSGEYKIYKYQGEPIERSMNLLVSRKVTTKTPLTDINLDLVSKSGGLDVTLNNDQTDFIKTNAQEFNVLCLPHNSSSYFTSLLFPNEMATPLRVKLPNYKGHINRQLGLKIKPAKLDNSKVTLDFFSKTNNKDKIETTVDLDKRLILSKVTNANGVDNHQEEYPDEIGEIFAIDVVLREDKNYPLANGKYTILLNDYVLFERDLPKSKEMPDLFEVEIDGKNVKLYDIQTRSTYEIDDQF